MYGMVLMVAVTGSGDTASFGKRGGGCNGTVVVANSCQGGGGFLGMRGGRGNGCNGGGGHFGGRGNGCNGGGNGCNGGGFLGLRNRDRGNNCCGAVAAPACCAPVAVAAPVVVAPAPVAVAPAPVVAASPCCAPAPTCCDPCAKKRGGLLSRLCHKNKGCATSCATSYAAPACSTCGTTGVVGVPPVAMPVPVPMKQ